MFRIYLKNLPKLVTKDWLMAHFLPYGPISSLKIVKNKQGVCKGHGKLITRDRSTYDSILSRTKHSLNQEDSFIVEPYLEGAPLLKRELSALPRQVAVFNVTEDNI